MSGLSGAPVRHRQTLVDYAVFFLIVEKIIQHVFVSLAFFFNWADIASTVVVDPKILLVLGSVVAVLFCVAFWGMTRAADWAINLVLGLALFDIIGEFVAQGTIVIKITVSFLAACVLFVLAIVLKRRLNKDSHIA